MKKTLCVVAMAALAAATWFCIGQEIKNNVLHAGYGSCGKCKRTWDVVSGHLTPYADAHWTVTTPKGTNLMMQVVGVPNDGGTHKTTVTNGVSCFPLCEQCWTELKTPEARLPYYRKLVDERKKWDTATEKAEDTWPRMKASVLAGN